MQHVDITGALIHGHASVQALAEALARADGGPSIQRTLATVARDRCGASWTVEVVLRLERMDNG